MINTGRINATPINGRSGAQSVAPTVLVAGAVVTYTCTLSGSPTLTLPISSAQLRKYSGKPSYLSVVVPDGSSLIDAINARSAGTLIVTRQQVNPGGAVVTGVIASVTLESISYTRGARTSSVTLSGHSTVTNVAPFIRELVNVAYFTTENGSSRYRSEVDHTLTPGDTARTNQGDFLIEQLSIFLSAGLATMDVAERAS